MPLQYIKTIKRLNLYREKVISAIDDTWTITNHEDLHDFIWSITVVLDDHRKITTPKLAGDVDNAFAKITKEHLQYSTPKLSLRDYIDQYEKEVSDFVYEFTSKMRDVIFPDLEYRLQSVLERITSKLCAPPQTQYTNNDDREELISLLKFEIDTFIRWLYYLNHYVDAIEKNTEPCELRNFADKPRNFACYEDKYYNSLVQSPLYDGL